MKILFESSFITLAEESTITANIISMLHGWNIDPPRGGIMRRDGDLLAMKEI